MDIGFESEGEGVTFAAREPRAEFGVELPGGADHLAVKLAEPVTLADGATANAFDVLMKSHINVPDAAVCWPTVLGLKIKLGAPPV